MSLTIVSTDTKALKANGYSALKAHSEQLNGDADNLTFVLREKRHFQYETRPIPTLVSEDQVLVAVCATGLCGSDIHYWTHGEIGDFRVRKPLVLGHESAGIVTECGSAVRSLKPGDRVALEPGIPCRTCESCQTGRYNLCPDVHFAATPPYDGTLAGYYTMPENLCYKLPPQISMEEGALIEPLSVAVHCAKLGGVTFGSSVIVLGAGPIGLLCCAVACAFGATKAVAVDIVAPRLEFARVFAATTTYQMEPSLTPAENAARILSDAAMEEGAEIVIDATGAETCISTGIHTLKRGGTFVQAGLGAANINFPIAQLCSKEGNFRGSFRYGPGDYKDAVQLLQYQKVSVKELITHRYDFGEAEVAFENVEKRQGIKTIIYGPNTSRAPQK